MFWASQKKIWILVILSVIILFGIGYFSYLAAIRFIDDRNQVSHTHEVLAKLEATLSSLKDAEAGQRGYLLTGDETYLEPYRATLAEINDQVSNLKALTADNLIQQSRLITLTPLIGQRLDLIKESLDAA